MQKPKYKVYENVLTPEQINKFKTFYTTQAQFQWNKLDQNHTSGTSFLQNTGWDLKRSIEMFGIDDWIEQYIRPVEPKVKANDFHDAYVNVLLSGDDFDNHRDIEELKDDQYYVSCVLMLNPYMDDPGAGFEIDNEFLRYKFNTLIVFDGSYHHRPIAPLGGWLRVTYYCSFSNAFKVRYDANSTGYNNPWHRSKIINQKFIDRE